MLKILSPLEMIQRVDVNAKAGVFTSGTTGSWIQLSADSSNNPVADFPNSNFAGGWAIWTEGIRSVVTAVASTTNLGQLQPLSAGGAGFSPDAARTGKVTTLVGKWRGLTDQVDRNDYAIGQYLVPSTTTGGKLTRVNAATAYVPANYYSGGNNIPVAVIRGGPYTSYSYLGQTYTGVYEIEAIV